jgi:DNA replication and repair protein RecF
MPLAGLEIDQFRCLERIELTLDPHYNLFVGPNASGKTSLLEASFFLGRGRSFRTRRLDRLVRHGQSEFRLVGHVQRGGVSTVLGIAGSRHGTEIRVGGAPAVGVAELAEHLPAHVIDPEVHKLLEEGPGRRRRFLDWGVFHVEQSFLGTWQRYQRALKQRNSALRAARDERLARAWDPEVVAAGEGLLGMRTDYLRLLEPELASLGRELLGLEVALVHHAGWPTGTGLQAALEASIERDRRFGVTHVGPHRADVVVQVEGLAARERVSRGQQKLLAAALVLAQIRVQERQAPGRAVLLLDDPAAELDAGNLERLLGVVRGLPAQLFVTALRPELAALGAPGQSFHVEHGAVTALG